MMEHEGIITRIIDGDTIEVTVLEVEVLPKMFLNIPYVALRLVAIDAPERYTEEGREAKAYMETVFLNARVRILFTGKKSFDRYIAEVIDEDGDNLSTFMVDFGHAKYKEY